MSSPGTPWAKRSGSRVSTTRESTSAVINVTPPSGLGPTRITWLTPACAASSGPTSCWAVVATYTRSASMACLLRLPWIQGPSTLPAAPRSRRVIRGRITRVRPGAGDHAPFGWPEDLQESRLRHLPRRARDPSTHLVRQRRRVPLAPGVLPLGHLVLAAADDLRRPVPRPRDVGLDEGRVDRRPGRPALPRDPDLPDRPRAWHGGAHGPGELPGPGAGRCPHPHSRGDACDPRKPDRPGQDPAGLRGDRPAAVREAEGCGAVLLTAPPPIDHQAEGPPR